MDIVALRVAGTRTECLFPAAALADLLMARARC
jgi:hypothetical protein